MAAVRTRRWLLPHLRRWSVLNARNSSAAALSVELPQKIDRKPTDLLKALASTVNLDPTAAPYSFVDDPYLIPGAEHSAISFALSKEGGRRTAIWMAKHWPTLFEHDYDEPRRDAFRPQLVQDKFDPESMPATVEQLEKFILNRRVQAAWDLYQHLSEANVPVSSEVKLNLFVLLCYYNSADIIEYFPEAKWLRKLYDLPPSTPTTWNVGGPADLLWELMTDEEKTPEMYAARICALAKFCPQREESGKFSPAKPAWLRKAVERKEKRNQAEAEQGDSEGATQTAAVIKADACYTLFGEMKSKFPDKMSAHPEVFHWVMETYGAHLPAPERVGFVKSILAEMAEYKVMPSVETFNAAAAGVGLVHEWRRTRFQSDPAARKNMTSFFRQIIAEMTSLGLEPSLHIYSCLIASYPRYLTTKFNSVSVVLEILNHLEGKTSLEPTCDKDSNFFGIVLRMGDEGVIAVPDAAAKAKLKKVMLKLKDFVYSRRNAGFLSDYLAEKRFLSDYLSVLKKLDPELFLSELFKVAPNRVHIEGWIVNAAMEAVEFSAKYEYLPKLWGLLKNMNFRGDRNTTAILNTFAQMPESLYSDDEELRKNLAETLESVMQRKDECTPPPTAMDILTGIHVAVNLEEKNLVFQYCNRLKPSVGDSHVPFDLLPRSVPMFANLVKKLKAGAMGNVAEMLLRVAKENCHAETWAEIAKSLGIDEE